MTLHHSSLGGHPDKFITMGEHAGCHPGPAATACDFLRIVKVASHPLAVRLLNVMTAPAMPLEFMAVC